MATEIQTQPSPTWQRLAGRAQASDPTPAERCEFCSAPIPANHRHLLEVLQQELICVCMACSILFDQEAASVGKYRLVPDRRLYLDDFHLSDEQWAALDLPVDLAFFLRRSPVQQVQAYYPGPLGATESLLRLRIWNELEAANPVLREITPDVEALLVNRTGGREEHFLVPISDCYQLAGVMRGGWRGFSGGAQVWIEVENFFRELKASSRVMDRTVAQQ